MMRSLLDGRRTLNVAAGSERRPGWVAMDLHSPGADVKHDALVFPYPFPEASFDRVVCRQFIEHLSVNGADPLWPLLREFRRLVKPGGEIVLDTPSATCPMIAWTNPLHRRAFTPRSFDFLKGRDPSIEWEVGPLGLELARVEVGRHVHLGEWFDSSYHFPKYLGWDPNIGHVSWVRFTLRRPSLSSK